MVCLRFDMISLSTLCYIYIYILDVLYMFLHTRSCAPKILPSLDGKLERFVTKNGKSDCQT